MNESKQGTKLFGCFHLYFSVVDNKMQENNNFETTLDTWRMISGEQPPESNYVSMSGDIEAQPVAHSKKKEDEATLLMPDKSKNPVNEGTQTDKDVKQKEQTEKHGLIISDIDDKDTSSNNDDDIDDSDLENDKTAKSSENKNSDPKWDKSTCGDKVDSVYLRQQPSHKNRSAAASSIPEEDCGIKCLYYTLQCCDCVLM